MVTFLLSCIAGCSNSAENLRELLWFPGIIHPAVSVMLSRNGNTMDDYEMKWEKIFFTFLLVSETFRARTSIFSVHKGSKDYV